MTVCAPRLFLALRVQARHLPWRTLSSVSSVPHWSLRTTRLLQASSMRSLRNCSRRMLWNTSSHTTITISLKHILPLLTHISRRIHLSMMRSTVCVMRLPSRCLPEMMLSSLLPYPASTVSVRRKTILLLLSCLRPDLRYLWTS